jgi:hypothetical protein
VNYYNTRHYHHHRGPYRGEQAWNHNTSHRKGVAYRDRRTSEVYGSRPRQVSPVRPETRGYPARSTQRQDMRSSQAPIQRRDRTTAGPQTRTESGASQRPLQGREPAGTQQVRPQRERIQRSVRPDTPFRGIGQGSFERRAGERGGMSIRSNETRSSGGSYRGGVQGGGSRGGVQGGGSRGSGQSGGSRR